MRPELRRARRRPNHEAVTTAEREREPNRLAEAGLPYETFAQVPYAVTYNKL